MLLKSKEIVVGNLFVLVLVSASQKAGGPMGRVLHDAVCSPETALPVYILSLKK